MVSRSLWRTSRPTSRSLEPSEERYNCSSLRLGRNEMKYQSQNLLRGHKKPGSILARHCHFRWQRVQAAIALVRPVSLKHFKLKKLKHTTKHQVSKLKQDIK